ncbi:hypothetical protein LINPERHAP2_LOCUS32964 [Linum perenne]
MVLPPFSLPSRSPPEPIR